MRNLEQGPPSGFVFEQIPDLKFRDVDVGRDDILQNYTIAHDLAMNGIRSWCGPCQKSLLLLQMLIEFCSLSGDVVLDSTTATSTYLLFLLISTFKYVYIVMSYVDAIEIA